MSQGKEVMIVRSHHVRTVHEMVDSDGVVTSKERVQKFRGKPTSVSLYVKLFKGDCLDLTFSLDGVSFSLLSHCLNELDAKGGECWLVPSTMCKKFEGAWSKASVYKGIKKLLVAGLIKNIESYRYMVNPYYAAVGSDAEVKELRERWDYLTGVSESITKTEGDK